MARMDTNEVGNYLLVVARWPAQRSRAKGHLFLFGINESDTRVDLKMTVERERKGLTEIILRTTKARRHEDKLQIS